MSSATTDARSPHLLSALPALFLAIGLGAGLHAPSPPGLGITLALCSIAGIAAAVLHRKFPYAALTPLTAEPHPHGGLAGVSLDVTVRVPGTRPAFATRGGFLFTHRGWSGPTVLDASHHATRASDGETREIRVQWCDLEADDWRSTLAGGSGQVRGVLARELPRRLADTLMDEAGVAGDTALAQLRRADREALVAQLSAYPLPWTGHEGYKKAEVTGGGVALSEVEPRTLESRRHDGLFLCGEILDAIGPIGGHNFLWAWATGRSAGTAAAG